MKLKEILELAKTVHENLRSDDKRFKMSVYIQHKDGSAMMFSNAFVDKIKDEECSATWYLLFTEHHGYQVYMGDDLKNIRLFEEKVIYKFDPEAGKTKKIEIKKRSSPSVFNGGCAGDALDSDAY